MKNRGDFRFTAINHIYAGLGLTLNDIDAILMYVTSVTHFSQFAIYGHCSFQLKSIALIDISQLHFLSLTNMFLIFCTSLCVYVCI